MSRKTEVYPKDELACKQHMMFKIYIFYHGDVSTIILPTDEGSKFFFNWLCLNRRYAYLLL